MPAKTNAMRLLESQNTSYIAHEYHTVDGEMDGLAVARKPGGPLRWLSRPLLPGALAASTTSSASR